MSQATRKNPFFVGFLFLIVIVFVPKLFLSESALYTKFLTERPLLFIGSLSRLLFLLLGFVWAWRAASQFEKDNPARPAWRLLACGLFSYLLGQSVLGVYQLVLAVPAPYPSFGDAFFMVAMCFWLVSLALFIRAYTQAGFMEAGIRRAVVVTLLATLLLGGVGLGVLMPIIEAPAPAMEKALNLAYPLADLLLLIPVLVLLQMVLKLRGGKLWQTWMALLIGFVCLAVGDVLFAYFTSMEMVYLDPLLDVLYTSSYIFIAWGVASQADLSQ